MLDPTIRQLITDRFSIKATRKIRRRATDTDISRFFLYNSGAIENAFSEFIKTSDKLINDFLEKVQNENTRN